MIQCDYCDSTDVRETCPSYGQFAASYCCEECFAGQDDGPCWDDLPRPKVDLCRGAEIDPPTLRDRLTVDPADLVELKLKETDDAKE